MQTLSPAGPRFRTKCLPLQHAAAFARCLRGNAQYHGVELAESPKAKGDERWIVFYSPASVERIEAMLAHQQDARAQRAEETAFQVFPDLAGVGTWVLNGETGGCYLVTEHACTCPDHRFRLAKFPGLKCKHRVAVEARTLADVAADAAEFVAEAPVAA